MKISLQFVESVIHTEGTGTRRPGPGNVASLGTRTDFFESQLVSTIKWG